ncbi:helix-turn-helix transcriptional regulator [Clostridium cochlearium]|uniref:helix-turn-helix domain-containing protein n=1 Tax=Clostridium cochlearium TaxID=1494 RepID=UPI001459707B|nr:helix-turn-helix transcriptional regulator [Clostridium cochlearium]NME94421.1 helix-turn-helix transcriptional regulator [Clostridium cochlearium]
MKLHCRLSTLMGEHRFSIQDVHERTKLSRTTVSNLYNDKATRINYKTIEKLCSLFDCGVAELLYIDGSKNGEGEEIK